MAQLQHEKKKRSAETQTDLHASLEVEKGLVYLAFLTDACLDRWEGSNQSLGFLGNSISFSFSLSVFLFFLAFLFSFVGVCCISMLGLSMYVTFIVTLTLLLGLVWPAMHEVR